MQKNHACEEKSSKCTNELTLSNNNKLVRFSRIIVQLKIKHDVWQPILISHYKPILSLKYLESHIAEKEVS